MIRVLLDANDALADLQGDPEVAYALATDELVVTLAAHGGEVVLAIPAAEGPAFIDKLMAARHRAKIAARARAELAALEEPLPAKQPTTPHPATDPVGGMAGRIARRKAAGRDGVSWRAMGRLDVPA